MPLYTLKSILILLCVTLMMGVSLPDVFRIIPTQLKENPAKHPNHETPALTFQLPRKSTLGNFGMNPDIMPVSYDYYDIKGQNVDTLIGQIHQLGPDSKAEGKMTLGTTQWGIRWGVLFSNSTRKRKWSVFGGSQKGNVCTRINIQATGFIKFTMPRWVDYLQSSPALKKKWDAFYQDLQWHEDRHALHGVRALKEVQQLKPRLTRTATCKSVFDDFSKRASKIIEKYKKKDIEFDYDQAVIHAGDPLLK